MKKLLLFLLTIVAIQDIYAQDVDPRTANYRLVDSTILSLGSNEFNTPEELAAFIDRTFSTPHEKLRGVYRWVTNNVSYGHCSSTDPSQVFKTRQTVCQGYAELFKYLCDLTHIECNVIKGMGKNDTNTSDHCVYVYNHAWNKVTLYDKPYLLDVGWAAAGSYTSQTNDFTKGFNDAYFLTLPETFILQHFPTNPEDQLLATPLSKKEFCDAPSFNYGAIMRELTAYSPASAKIITSLSGRTVFSFSTQKPISSLSLQIITKAQQDEIEESNITFEQSANKVSFTHQFKKAGIFYFIIFIDNYEGIYYLVEVEE